MAAGQTTVSTLLLLSPHTPSPPVVGRPSTRATPCPYTCTPPLGWLLGGHHATRHMPFLLLNTRSDEGGHHATRRAVSL